MKIQFENETFVVLSTGFFSTSFSFAFVCFVDWIASIDFQLNDNYWKTNKLMKFIYDEIGRRRMCNTRDWVDFAMFAESNGNAIDTTTKS